MSHLLTIRQFSEKHPAFPQGGLRAIRFNSEQNGFAPAFVTVGRKVLIDENKFFAIVETQSKRVA
jgi:hypothetical protein